MLIEHFHMDSRFHRLTIGWLTFKYFKSPFRVALEFGPHRKGITLEGSARSDRTS